LPDDQKRSLMLHGPLFIRYETGNGSHAGAASTGNAPSTR
jgi:hypothetical protein